MEKKELTTAREFLNSRRLFNTNYFLSNQEYEAIKITDMLEDYAHVKCEALREENERLKDIIKEYAKVNSNAVMQLWEQHCTLNKALNKEDK